MTIGRHAQELFSSQFACFPCCQHRHPPEYIFSPLVQHSSYILGSYTLFHTVDYRYTQENNKKSRKITCSELVEVSAPNISSNGVFLVALPIRLAPFRAGSRASLTCPNGVPSAGFDRGPFDLLTAYVFVASAPNMLTYD